MRILPLIASLIALTACVDFIDGNGVEATEERSVPTFRAVSAENFARVIVTKGDPSVVVTCDENLLEVIETEVRDDTLRVKNRQMTTSVRTDLSCTVEVSAPLFTSFASAGSGGLEASGIFTDVTRISSSGSGSVDISSIDSSALDVTASGSGSITVADAVVPDLIVRDSGSASIEVLGVVSEVVDGRTSGSGRITLVGEAVSVDLRSSGSGGIDAVGLLASDADVRVSGSGSIGVFASESVDIVVSGSGSVDVFGNPEARDETVSGSGRVVYH